MLANYIVDAAEGLVTAMASVCTIVPPFTIVAPSGTNLKQQYVDGQDDLGTLEERLLRIENVKHVRVGDNKGLSIEHFEG